MGSKGIRPRRPRRRLAKVPRNEEPNQIPLAGLGGSSTAIGHGRQGHEADHHAVEPGRAGRLLLRLLGRRPRDRGPST
jgi:hypothetical protein